MTAPVASGAPWLAAHHLVDGEYRPSGDAGSFAVADRIVEVLEGSSDLRLPQGVTALARGAAQVIPLAWGPADTSTETRARMNELWSGVRTACEFRHGTGLDVPVDAPDTAYAAELARCGVRRADWWASGESALVLVVHGGPLPSPSTAMALHVVPLGWVSELRRSKKMVVPDLAWSREDVA
ncbi:hypothetical protein [Microbacterium dauci]|uniref:Histidine phosphatase family protein n=1 Tax=Microbacterium dauci TaxID=3048008 RepID=A0ABT6Z9J3_9MICO|nr:hypothetical protein [Microbacterium sp. LX3-4]MDJ1112829.1 hypothetical protein [Microbacterium sp. LX3-4]